MLHSITSRNARVDLFWSRGGIGGQPGSRAVFPWSQKKNFPLNFSDIEEGTRQPSVLVTHQTPTWGLHSASLGNSGPLTLQQIAEIRYVCWDAVGWEPMIRWRHSGFRLQKDTAGDAGCRLKASPPAALCLISAMERKSPSWDRAYLPPLLS